MIAIETQGLTRYYGDLCAVDHLDLQIPEGDLFAFLGPNGAGKTTTIRLLTGLIRPTQGRAWIHGLDVTTQKAMIKSLVGIVPQRSNLYAELSARENLLFMAKLYGLPRRDWRPRVNALLEAFGLTAQADTRFGVLSGGMKRRLTIAAALIHNPPILFLDEPTTGLDAQAARSLRQMIKDLNRQGVTIFLTTHLIHEAEMLAKRVGILLKGRLIVVDTLENLRAPYQKETRLEIEVPSADDTLLEALCQNAAIKGSTRMGERLTLVTTSTEAALEAILRTLRARRLPLRSIRTVNPSLEDIFVALTQFNAETMRTEGNATLIGRT